MIRERFDQSSLRMERTRQLEAHPARRWNEIAQDGWIAAHPQRVANYQERLWFMGHRQPRTGNSPAAPWQTEPSRPALARRRRATFSLRLEAQPWRTTFIAGQKERRSELDGPTDSPEPGSLQPPDASTPPVTAEAAPLSSTTSADQRGAGPVPTKSFSIRGAITSLFRATSVSLLQSESSPSLSQPMDARLVSAGGSDVYACFGEQRTLFDKPASFDSRYLRRLLAGSPALRRQTWLLLAKYSQSIYRKRPFDSADCIEAMRSAEQLLALYAASHETDGACAATARDGGGAERSPEQAAPSEASRLPALFASLFGASEPRDGRGARRPLFSFFASASASDERPARAAAPQPAAARPLELTALRRETCAQIDRDVPRTGMGPFMASAEGQRRLFLLLLAHSDWNSDVGYCQSLSFVAAAILLGMESERASDADGVGATDAVAGDADERDTDADVLFVLRAIVDVYLPRDLFSGVLHGLMAEVNTFDALLERTQPALHAHCVRLAYEAGQPSLLEAFLVRWFSTLFAHMMPWTCALHLVDAFLCDGIEVLHRVALAFMARLSAQLMEIDDPYDFCQFLQVACSRLEEGDAASASLLIEEAYALAGFPDNREYHALRFERHAAIAQAEERSRAGAQAGPADKPPRMWTDFMYS